MSDLGGGDQVPPSVREVAGKIDPQERRVDLRAVVRQQRHALHGRVATALAMRPEVLVYERSVSSVAKLLGGPEISALSLVGAKPSSRGLMVAREGVRKVLHLEELPDERTGRVAVAGRRRSMDARASSPPIWATVAIPTTRSSPNPCRDSPETRCGPISDPCTQRT